MNRHVHTYAHTEKEIALSWRCQVRIFPIITTMCKYLVMQLVVVWGFFYTSAF